MLRFIGVVESVKEELSRVRIFDEFAAGLQGLDTFSHLIILYWFHRREDEESRRVLKVTPRRHPGAPEVGVFASRSPSRPNPIGFAVTERVKREGTILWVKGLDAVEGSPILDIKPYLPRADAFPEAVVPEWTLRGPKT
ncbi:MAG: tRNA (N6-threonylcarbamoyladenosine(37)-N6)-methyltransferase TrmO [Methanophagales archaeon ANME-1-THS]|nr:MAG: tRNA (N6-threonylcarbamoyladenosine(37)-N6)-methyltransferase TrmO [Methanophagales archaeon ANME-1-THS]